MATLSVYPNPADVQLNLYEEDGRIFLERVNPDGSHHDWWQLLRIESGVDDSFATIHTIETGIDSGFPREAGTEHVQINTP